MKVASSIVTTVLLGTVPVRGEVLSNVTRVTLVSAVLSGTVLVCVALIVATLLRRAAAAARHRVWGMTLVALLVVPLLSLVVPLLLANQVTGVFQRTFSAPFIIRSMNGFRSS